MQRVWLKDLKEGRRGRSGTCLQQIQKRSNTGIHLKADKVVAVPGDFDRFSVLTSILFITPWTKDIPKS